MYEVNIFCKNASHTAWAEDLDHIRVKDGVLIVNTFDDNVLIVQLAQIEYVETKVVDE